MRFNKLYESQKGKDKFGDQSCLTKISKIYAFLLSGNYFLGKSKILIFLALVFWNLEIRLSASYTPVLRVVLSAYGVLFTYPCLRHELS